MKNNLLNLFLVSVFLLGCKNSKELSALYEARDVIREKKSFYASFCSPTEAPRSKLNYYLFIIDSSLSNTEHDPGKTLRKEAIGRFINGREHNPDDRFGLISFQDQAKLMKFNEKLDESEKKIKFSRSLFLNKDEFKVAVSDFAQDQDAGYSNLKAAIELAYELILHQQEFEDYRRYNQGILDEPYSNIHYKIFILTDGIAKHQNGVDQSTQDLSSAAKTLFDLADKSNPDNVKTTVSSIELNTGLYFFLNEQTIDCNNDDNSGQEYCKARELLSETSAAAGGVFKDFSQGLQSDPIDFEEYLPLTYRPLRNLIFYNIELTGLVWNKTSGKFEADSDGDGLSDQEELTLGSSPHQKDSDQDGLSDHVQFLITGSVCQERGCPQASSAYPGCYRVGGDFVDSDFDGLNNCEEVLLRSALTSSDTNRNFISDAQMMRLGINPSIPLDLWSDEDLDGLSFEKELKNFTPPRLKNAFIKDDLPAPTYKLEIDEELTKVEMNKCYKLEVKDLPITTEYNDVRLNLVFQDRIQKEEVLHQYAKKVFRFGERMSFEREDIKSLTEQ